MITLLYLLILTNLSNSRAMCVYSSNPKVFVFLQFRFLIVLALCGHLAHATAIPSETSSRTTTTERYVTATVKSTETVDGGWSSYTDALVSKMSFCVIIKTKIKIK